MKRGITVFVITIAFAVAFVSSSPSSTGGKWGDWDGGRWENNFNILDVLGFWDTLRVPQDYPTIQEAIDDASFGDTVLVSDGTYEGMITMKRGVIIRSENGPLTTTLDGAGEWRVVAGSDWSVLRGFTITNGWWGVDCWDGSPLIYNNIITGTYAIGINSFVSDAIILNNKISGMSQGIASLYSEPRVLNNTITDCQFGIWVSYSNGLFQNNLINNCTIGFHLEDNCVSLEMRNNNLWRNTLNVEDQADNGTGFGDNDTYENITFENILAGNYQLAENSYGIDDGLNFTFSGLLTDLAGNPRVTDGDNDNNAVIDLGAYEYQG